MLHSMWTIYKSSTLDRCFNRAYHPVFHRQIWVSLVAEQNLGRKSHRGNQALYTATYYCFKRIENARRKTILEQRGSKDFSCAVESDYPHLYRWTVPNFILRKNNPRSIWADKHSWHPLFRQVKAFTCTATWRSNQVCKTPSIVRGTHEIHFSVYRICSKHDGTSWRWRII